LTQNYLQLRALELAPQAYASGPLFADDGKLTAKQGVRSVVDSRYGGAAAVGGGYRPACMGTPGWNSHISR
jgi:hypothetical protein